MTSQNLRGNGDTPTSPGDSSNPSSPASKTIDNSGEKSMVAAGGHISQPPAASLTEDSWR